MGFEKKQAVAGLLATCLFSACDGFIVISSAPSVVPATLAFVEVSPASLSRSLFPGQTCAVLSPVAVPFSVNVTAGTSPVTVSEVRFHSSDPFRSVASPTLYDSTSLSRKFGNATVASFGYRTFGFTHTFPCVTGGVVLYIWVTTTDGSGVARQSAHQVPMR
jgi:hypothetical protein